MRLLRRHSHLAWVFCLAGMLAGCAAPQQTARVRSCPVAEGTPLVVFELFFGRSIQGRGEVGHRAWDDFLERVVTPNLPNGYTVSDAIGAWMNPATSRTIRERTKVLLAALPDDAGSAAAIARIRHAYDVRFHQMQVGMTVAAVCGSF
ncbi:MAG TPA: DUF3574 domain-containing protein [Acetobacteraceae bacterium]|nr:DUF3574 domain-containing protein [Acetobacteraceae bacterium]